MSNFPIVRSNSYIVYPRARDFHAGEAMVPTLSRFWLRESPYLGLFCAFQGLLRAKSAQHARVGRIPAKHIVQIQTRLEPGKSAAHHGFLFV